MALFGTIANAAPQKKAAPARKANAVVVINSRVTDQDGKPIEDAVITSGEGALTSYTDNSGKFSIKSKVDAVILVEAAGFKDAVINVKAGVPATIKLTKEPLRRGSKDLRSRSDGGADYQHDIASAIGVVDVDKLEKYPDLTLANALQGSAAGLMAISGDGGLGNNGTSLFVRGRIGGGSGALVVVDGIDRAIGDLAVEEIGSIEILKDASAKILYGPRATDGVILVTTKRGAENKRIIKVSAEYGVSQSTRVPTFLNSYDYANLYNEARRNDGLGDYYLPYQIEGYKNSTGENDLLYPNIDWYSMFAKPLGTYRKASAQFIGGNNRVKYSVVAAYTGGSGTERVAKPTQINRFNVRGNLDIRINDFLTATADVAARLQWRNYFGMTSGSLYSKISTYRPNEYPFIINPENIGMEPNEDGTPFYGGSAKHSDNVYADMVYGGDKSEQYVNTQTNFGLNFDFDKYVKGLFADAFITFDNYSSTNSSLSRAYPTYAIDEYLDEEGVQQMRITQLKKLNQSDDITITSHSTKRALGFRVDGGYKRNFGDHGLTAIAAFRYHKIDMLGARQDCVTTNTTLRLGYSYKNRLFVEAIAGLAGSNQFKNKKFLPVGSASIAYVILEEPFLKVKASGGRLGYNSNSNYLLYNTAWRDSGNYALGNNNNTSAHTTALIRVGNPDLGWETQEEANLGVEGAFLRNRLIFEVNGFFEQRDNRILGLGSKYSSLIGDYLPQFNYGIVRNAGAELEIAWNDKATGGDFRYEIGANVTFARDWMFRNSQLPGVEDYRTAIGRPTSSIMGLKSEGLFGKDVPLEGHAKQMFGYYTIGDVAYKDMNGDGYVDDHDVTYLGQSFPLASLGINIDLKYKGFELYLLGTANLGQTVQLNNQFYQNTGIESYSTYALNRYHPVNNPDGFLPRLTSTTGNNSYRTSDVWIADGSWFRLKDVEFSYTFENRKAGIGYKTIKIFLRGTNLFVLSGIKELDPERLDAGINNTPAYRTMTGGISIGF